MKNNRKFRRLLSALLVFAVTLTLLAGCASKSGKEDWDYIKSKGKMIIGITYYAPMNYKDESGKLIGFETEFSEALCAKLGIEAVFQEIDWDAKETELAAKNIDCIWNGMTKTPARAENMDLSVSYLHNKPVIVVRADDIDKYKTADDLKGAVIVGESGSQADEIIKEDEFFAQGTHVSVDTQLKSFMELAAKTADMVVGDYVMAIGSLGAGTDFENLVICEKYKSFDPLEYAIAFRKGSPKTLEAVNAAIKELIDSGELQIIADKYKLGELLIK